MKMRRKLGFSFPILVLCLVSQSTHSSPVSRSSRMVREVYPDDQEALPQANPPTVETGNQAKVCIVGDVVYGVGESVPSEQPCLKCTCEAPAVNCETVICQQQQGCKAIHRPNKCCPDYQCECQHEGRTYANGERLSSANGSDCHVCYCRGGEVQCAEVGCYTRDDCEPSYIPGQCCPRYDHCPPKEPLADRIQYTTESSSISRTEETSTLWTISGAPVIGQFLTSTSTQSERQTPQPILENEGSGDDTSEFLPTTNDVSSPAVFSIKEIESKKRTPVETKTVVKIDKGSQITIQEVIPQQKEIQITSAPKEGTTLKSPIKIIEDSSNELVDTQSYASEKTEVYDHPPPVLRIGDQLLFFKQGQLVPEVQKDASTPSPVITLIGAEGLQIGLGSEEVIEHELLPTNNERKKEDGLQDISVSIEEDTVTGSPNSEDCSEEYIILPEESKVIEVSSTEVPKLSPTTQKVDQKLHEIPNSIKVSPIKRDQELISTTGVPDLPQASFRSPSTTEFIPEENPYYPPIPEDLLTLEDHEIGEKKELEVTTFKPSPSVLEVVTKKVEELSTKGYFNTKLHEKTIKELKNEGRLDELMLQDSPVTEESGSESQEDTTQSKKFVDVSSRSQESNETASEETASTKKDIHLEDPEVSSEEPSSEEQKDQPQRDEEDSKLLPEVIPLISNKTLPSSSEKPLDWLKKESTKAPDPKTKFSPVLINEKASLPREILDKHHETDAFLEEEDEPTTKVSKTEKDSSSFNEKSSETTPFPKEQDLHLVRGLPEDSTSKQEPTKIDLLPREKKDSLPKGTKSPFPESTKVAEVIVEKATEVPTVKERDSKSPIMPTSGVEDLLEAQTKSGVQVATETPKEIQELIKSSASLDNKNTEVEEILEVRTRSSVTKATTELHEEKSKESLEKSTSSSEETSKETTTNKGDFSNIMADDASVEIGKESSLNTEELVETLPGFEATTHKMEEKVSSQDSSEELYGRTNPKSEVEVLVTKAPIEEVKGVGKSDSVVTQASVTKPKQEDKIVKDEKKGSPDRDKNILTTQAPVEDKKKHLAQETNFPKKIPNPIIDKETHEEYKKGSHGKHEDHSISQTSHGDHKKVDKHPKIGKGVAPHLGVVPLETIHEHKEHKKADHGKEVVSEDSNHSKNGSLEPKPKRDVVKKVLKDPNFENPTENIQTELTEDAPPKVLEEIIHEHDLAEQRAMEELNSQEGANVEFDSEVKIEDDFGDNPTKIQKIQPSKVMEAKSTEVIQRIGDVRKLRESTEALDTGLLGIFRDFISKKTDKV